MLLSLSRISHILVIATFKYWITSQYTWLFITNTVATNATTLMISIIQQPGNTARSNKCRSKWRVFGAIVQYLTSAGNAPQGIRALVKQIWLNKTIQLPEGTQFTVNIHVSSLSLYDTPLVVIGGISEWERREPPSARYLSAHSTTSLLSSVGE